MSDLETVLGRVKAQIADPGLVVTIERVSVADLRTLVSEVERQANRIAELESYTDKYLDHMSNGAVSVLSMRASEANGRADKAEAKLARAEEALKRVAYGNDPLVERMSIAADALRTLNAPPIKPEA